MPGLEGWLARLPQADGDALRAVAALGARTGAREFQFGCQYPELPFEQRSWWALAVFEGGQRLMAEGQVSAAAACDGLAGRLLDGGRCLGCGKLSFVHNPAGYRVADAAAAARAKREGVCRWRRDGGPVWVRECGEAAPQGSTREALAQAMAACGVVEASQIAAARAGRYDEYLSEASPFPLMLLVEELRPYGQATAQLVSRVINGDFDASGPEALAFWNSPEGRQVFEEFGAQLPAPGGAAGPKPGARAGARVSRRKRQRGR